MGFKSRSNTIVTVVGTVMLLIHLILKIFKIYLEPSSIKTIVKAVLYLNDILIFLLWGVSIYWRVVQKHILRALLAVVGIETFWIGLRTLKYAFFHDSVILCRYSWYLFYIPMLMLPAMCLKLAMFIGKDERNAAGKNTTIFQVLSTLMFIPVITNDLHRLVFDIPPGIDGMRAGNYKYGIVYFIIFAYIVICAAASLIIMYRNCGRLRGWRSGVYPIMPFGFVGVICTLNLFGVQNIDITFTACFGVSASLEACLQTGIIQTNRGYRHIFRSSSIGLEITDSSLNPLLASDAYIPVSDDIKKSTLTEPVILSSNIRISASPIIYGYAVWEDDLSELVGTIQRIEYANEFLQDKNEALQAKYVSAKREHQLKEKNRLYNMLFDQSESYIRYYEELTEKLAAAEDSAQYYELSIKIAYVSAFIKRRINIIFLDEEDKVINCRELKLCIDELLKILTLSGIDCISISELQEPMTFEIITSLYERFYNITAGLTDKISSLYVTLIEECGEAQIILDITSDNDLSHIPHIEHSSNNEWTVKIK